MTRLNGSACMRIHINSTEGLNGRMDCSYEEMGTWLSASPDEVDIFGAVIIDDNIKNDHFEVLFLSMLLRPIVEYIQLSRFD